MRSLGVLSKFFLTRTSVVQNAKALASHAAEVRINTNVMNNLTVGHTAFTPLEKATESAAQLNIYYSPEKEAKERLYDVAPRMLQALKYAFEELTYYKLIHDGTTIEHDELLQNIQQIIDKIEPYTPER